MENSLKDVKFNLVIDCEDLINIPETTMLARFASSVGFYPEMSFFNSFGGIFDGIVASMTGTKAGFATSADTQLRKILEITGLAATRLLLEEKQKKAAWQIKYGGSFGSEGGGGGEGGKTPPEPVINYPVIVIEGFMNREKAKNDFIYDLIAEWAATLVENHIAHVVFVSSNPASIKSLSKATPNRGIETLVLEDASAESALEFVRLRLGSLFSSMDLKLCIEGLGGRRTDLEHLVQKVRAGTKPLGRGLNPLNLSSHFLTHSSLCSCRCFCGYSFKINV